MSVMYPVSAVLFDWCGTLVGAANAYLQSATNHHVCSPLTSYNKSIARYSASSLLGIKKNCADHTKVEDAAANVVQLTEDAFELLEFLGAHNIKMGIVSNKSGSQLRKEVCAMELSEHFSAIIGGGDTGENKPSPEPVIAALEILEISPSKSVLFVGDSDSDTEAALRAGCLPVGYNNFSSKNALSFSNFRELGIFIEGLLVRKYEQTTSG